MNGKINRRAEKTSIKLEKIDLCVETIISLASHKLIQLHLKDENNEFE